MGFNRLLRKNRTAFDTTGLLGGQKVSVDGCLPMKRNVDRDKDRPTTYQ